MKRSVREYDAPAEQGGDDSSAATAAFQSITPTIDVSTQRGRGWKRAAAATGSPAFADSERFSTSPESFALDHATPRLPPAHVQPSPLRIRAFAIPSFLPALVGSQGCNVAALLAAHPGARTIIPAWLA